MAPLSTDKPPGKNSGMKKTVASGTKQKKAAGKIRNRTLGIALFENVVKVVELGFTMEEILLLNRVRGEFSSGMLHRGIVTRAEQLGDYTMDLITRAGIKTSAGYVNIPDQFTVIKEFAIPPELPEIVPDWMNWELSHYLIKPVEQYAVSWFSINDKSIYGAAVPKKIISQRIELLRLAGVSPKGVEPSTIAMHNAFTYFNRKYSKNLLMMVIDEQFTSVSVVIDGRFKYIGHFFIKTTSNNDYLQGFLPVFTVITKSLGFSPTKHKFEGLLVTGKVGATSQFGKLLSAAINIPLVDLSHVAKQVGYEENDIDEWLVPVGLAIEGTV